MKFRLTALTILILAANFLNGQIKNYEENEKKITEIISKINSNSHMWKSNFDIKYKVLTYSSS